ncbi:uncharacterized protein LOC114361834 [Ostrinia furnacalis]|uniref:uncharacterized protein LOC114361834 n=1 Tax=Ostrinia furnacalis TaxID=93504 RepID=UPI00103BD44D|nr:uncharacterized protein LOC114361834 [Ostrinia furnacalis]
MKRACGVCAASRDKACPRPAAPELKEAYRQFQVANYKCLCAAILIMRPEAKFYQFLFRRNVWEKLFDCEQQWKLPLKMTWSQQKTIHTVVDSPTGRTSATSASRTTRTRMFLRTLSENPLQFDLMDTDEEPPENSHEIELVDNELNSQECADTVIGLLQHASSLHHTGWVTALAEGLAGSAPLAQMVCNCREALKPHAGVLRGPLIEVMATTAREDNGRKLVNSLHVDIVSFDRLQVLGSVFAKAEPRNPPPLERYTRPATIGPPKLGHRVSNKHVHR